MGTGECGPTLTITASDRAVGDIRYIPEHACGAVLGHDLRTHLEMPGGAGAGVEDRDGRYTGRCARGAEEGGGTARGDCGRARRIGIRHVVSRAGVDRRTGAGSVLV